MINIHNETIDESAQLDIELSKNINEISFDELLDSELEKKEEKEFYYNIFQQEKERKQRMKKRKPIKKKIVFDISKQFPFIDLPDDDSEDEPKLVRCAKNKNNTKKELLYNLQCKYFYYSSDSEDEGHSTQF